jgi:hypothetical protein
MVQQDKGVLYQDRNPRQREVPVRPFRFLKPLLDADGDCPLQCLPQA